MKQHTQEVKYHLPGMRLGIYCTNCMKQIAVADIGHPKAECKHACQKGGKEVCIAFEMTLDSVSNGCATWKFESKK